MRRTLTIAAFAGLLAFLLVAVAMERGATDAVDRSLFMLFRDTERPGELSGGAGLLKAMVLLTRLGGTLVLTVLSAAGVLWLLVRREKAAAAYLALTMLLGTAVRYGLKAGFHRARPASELHQVSVDTFSFPSSHAMMSTIGYLTLGGLVLARAPPALRAPTVVLMAGLPLLVGVTRVYLGVHWPSDVAAGWAMGLAWASLTALAFQSLGAGKR